VQHLLRHSIPNGDPAAIFDRALTLLLAELSKTKFSAVGRPRPARQTRTGSRHISAAVKRDVCSAMVSVRVSRRTRPLH
jgi:hypothetical protein